MSQRSKGVFVCFTGIDGSGKSTLARRLAAYLENKGVPAKYVWGSSDMVVLRPLVAVGKATFLRRENAFANYKEYRKSVNRMFQNPLLSIGYRNLLLLEQFYQTFYKMRLPLLLGKTVISDRYVYDTIVGLAIDLNYSRERFHSVLRRFLRLCPKPDLLFLIDLPEEVAYRRKDDTPALDFLKLRRKLYLDLADECQAILLNGCSDLGDLERLTQDLVMKYLEDGEVKQSYE